MYAHLTRPKNWAGRDFARVAFMGHALLPGFLSSNLINDSLVKVGRDWPGAQDHPRFIRWISFPVMAPPQSGGRNVWVDFYVVPVFAPRFFKAIQSNEAYGWVEAAAEYAILRDAKPDDVDLVIGWGAYTKMATEHGWLFRHRRPEFADSPVVSTTHGDAGSAALAIEAVKLAQVKQLRLAVVGAYGAIGGVVSRAAAMLNPEMILLVGPPDRTGETEKLDKLMEQRRVVQEALWKDRPVEIHQDKSRACLEHKTNVIIVATAGNMSLKPEDVPQGALVLDVATPPACSPEHDWSGRMVLSAGCGQFADISVIPEGFGDGIWNCGSGGERVLWGCAGETIARAMFRWHGHLVGQNIPSEELVWSLDKFAKIQFVPQPPSMFGRLLAWEDVRAFCAQK